MPAVSTMPPFIPRHPFTNPLHAPAPVHLPPRDAFSPFSSYKPPSMPSAKKDQNEKVAIQVNEVADPHQTEHQHQHQHQEPMSLEYPEPEGELDVREALARKPGRWTVQGSIRAQMARLEPAQNPSLEKIKAERVANLERAKHELFAASEDMEHELKAMERRRSASYEEDFE